jgi:hypothetical protein
MAFDKSLLFLGLTLFTLIGFILKSISRYNPDSSSNNALKMMSQVTFIILTAVLWILLIIIK